MKHGNADLVGSKVRMLVSPTAPPTAWSDGQLADVWWRGCLGDVAINVSSISDVPKDAADSGQVFCYD